MAFVAEYIQSGESVDYTPGSDVAAGDVIVQGDLVGIAKENIPANTRGALAVTGVYRMPKATGQGTAISAGATVYWDATNKVVTTSSDGTKYLGKAVAAAGTADATVLVRLDQ